jgi:hypothetical protein
LSLLIEQRDRGLLGGGEAWRPRVAELEAAHGLETRAASLWSSPAITDGLVYVAVAWRMDALVARAVAGGKFPVRRSTASVRETERAS